MPRKRLSKDDLVERIRTGLDTKGWEITKTATRAMLDELGVVAREELVQEPLAKIGDRPGFLCRKPQARDG